MIYKWKSHTGKMAVDAQTAGEVCEEISRHGKLTPEALVDASRPEDAPLHPAFEWDDAKAAEEWRKEQGRYIIRHIEITPEVTSTPVRAFVSIERQEHVEENRQVTYSYHPIERVMSDEDMRAKLLAQAFVDLAAFRRKYVNLMELADVFAAIDALLAVAS